MRMRMGILGVGVLIGMGLPAKAWWMPVFPASGAKGDTLWQDTSAPGAPHIPRLAIGNWTYLANGKTLLIWSAMYGGGLPQRRFAPVSGRQKYSFQAPAPLATDESRKTSLVLWGNWQSPDGTTWNPLPFPSTRFMSYGVHSGVCLGGGIGETIERSLDSGRTWKTVHQGNGTGFVKEFVFPDSGSFREAGWVFAIAYPGRILMSKNNGLTWKEWPIPDSLGLSGCRIQGIGYSIGQSIWMGPPAPRFLWTLHLDSTTGRSRLARHWIDSGRAEIIAQGLPDTLTCLSAQGWRVFTGGGRDLYLVDYAGIVRKPFTLEQLPPGEVLMELHGDGDNYNSFALTRNLYYATYYESLISPQANRTGPSESAQRLFGRFLLPAGNGRALSFLANGRRLPSATPP